MHAMLVSLCCIGMCYWIDELSEQTRQGFPVWETPRHCKSKGVIKSSIILHHWPGHRHGQTPLGLYKPARQPHRTEQHYPLLADTTPWKGLFEIISFAHTHTHSQSVFLCTKARIIIHLKCLSHCSVNYLHNNKKGVAGQILNQCQDACDYTGFTFSLVLHPFLCRVPSALSTLPTASLNTHLQTSPHSTKEMVTSHSTAAIFVARVSLSRAERRMITVCQWGSHILALMGFDCDTKQYHRSFTPWDIK